MKITHYLIFFIPYFFSNSVFGQSTENEIIKSFAQRKQLAETSILKNYPARNIGPTVQGGRIIDIDVNLKNTKEFYLGYASGGIFKTINNGITFEPIFDHVDAMGVGDMALSQTDTDIIYVGTGEKNSSRSSYAGSGMYKTTDGGKTWIHLGLASTQHISKVVIHPQDNNTLWVAAMGALYSHNSERGVFKSKDGGKTWSKTLFVNDSTGIIDLVINPQNPKQLWASSWERTRKSWNFTGNGSGSSIYRSDDGGETWLQATNGLPGGKQVGRIGLDVNASKPNILYAIVDNQAEVKESKAVKKKEDALLLENFNKMTTAELQAIEDKKLDEFLKEQGFPKKYSAQVVKKDIREGKYTLRDMAQYFGGDANASLFTTKVTGAQLYRSDDAGNSWKRMNTYDLDGVFFTYGYYFSEMKVSPANADLIYIMGVPLLKSADGGLTWHRLDTLKGVSSIHVDHHALWINPNESKHMLLGNDGGLYQTYDEGGNWLHINNMPVGQFYTVNVDMETPFQVYGGLQDNGVLRGSSRSIPGVTKHWEEIMGGDGMYVAPDPRNSKVVYAGFQFGNYYRFDLEKNKHKKITPQHDIGQQPLRWNWRAPLLLSNHNPDVVYTAANKVYRSMYQGHHWEAISPDLTQEKKQGNVPISTISALAESTLKFGLLYAGTDDGNLWVCKEGGSNWIPVSEGLPSGKWISSVKPSTHQEATVFVSLNGYREDDFKAYVFMSEDYGKTWKSVKGNLPESVANIIMQDPVNPDLLYCGLDNGTYVSLDKGNTWHFFNKMLNVAAYDMMVHPRDHELVVGTHGRSIYVADVKPLQVLKDGGVNKGVMAFESESIPHSDTWGEKNFPWSKPNDSFVDFLYYVGKSSPVIQVDIYDDKKNVIKKLSGNGTVGFHTVRWDMTALSIPAEKIKSKTKKELPPASKYASKGKYTLKFINGSEISEINFEIK